MKIIHRFALSEVLDASNEFPAVLVTGARQVGKTTLLLCDTAGIRETDDKVENIGIERSLREIESAGLILTVLDASRIPDSEDEALVKTVVDRGAVTVALVNKMDIATGEPSEKLKELLSSFDYSVEISALTGEGFELLAKTVDSAFIDGRLDVDNDAIISGARQFSAISKAERILGEAIDSLSGGVSLDACCVDIECVMSALGELDGREIGEQIVSEIFSHFCVGK